MTREEEQKRYRKHNDLIGGVVVGFGLLLALIAFIGANCGGT